MYSHANTITSEYLTLYMYTVRVFFIYSKANGTHIACCLGLNFVTGLKISTSRQSIMSVENEEMTGQTSVEAVISC